MNPEALENETPSILESFGFPNTYTFSKNMAEQVLSKRRGNLRLTIVRPSSVLACHSQPFPGWVDSVGTAGSIHLPMGLGLTNTFIMDKKPFWQTVVPVDLFANAVLVTSMLTAKLPKP